MLSRKETLIWLEPLLLQRLSKETASTSRYSLEKEESFSEIVEDHLGRSPSVRNDEAAEIGTQPLGTFEVAKEERNQVLIFPTYWLGLLKISPSEFYRSFMPYRYQ